MRFLITGGTGFIGSYVARELVGRGDEIVAYDLYPRMDLIRDIADKVKVVRGDTSDFVELSDAVKANHIDKIIHMAFLLISDSRENPPRALRVNCVGSNNVLEAARRFDLKRVVVASSTAVYAGGSLYGKQAVNEDSLIKPNTLYGAFKVLNEFITDHYYEQYGIETINLRPTVVYGYGRQRGGFTFANDIIQYPASGKPAEIPYGNMDIDWNYVKDCAKAFVLASDTKMPKHRAFNIGGECRSFRDAAAIVKKYILNAQITLGDKSLDWVSRYDITRAREELGYKPSYTLEEGVKDFIQVIMREEMQRA